MRGQKEMNIFSHLRGQVHGFTSFKFHLKGKTVGNDFPLKRFQTRNTGHPDALGDPPRGKEPAVRESDIKRIVQWADRFGSRLFQIQRGGIFLALQMNDVTVGDLAQMDFHGKRLNENSAFGKFPVQCD